jgi:hypothetical protein
MWACGEWELHFVAPRFFWPPSRRQKPTAKMNNVIQQDDIILPHSVTSETNLISRSVVESLPNTVSSTQNISSAVESTFINTNLPNDTNSSHEAARAQMEASHSNLLPKSLQPIVQPLNILSIFTPQDISLFPSSTIPTFDALLSPSPNIDEGGSTTKRCFESISNMLNGYDNSNSLIPPPRKRSRKGNEPRQDKYKILKAFFHVYFFEDQNNDQNCVLKDFIYQLYVAKIPKNYQLARNALYREMWSLYRNKIKPFQSNYREYVKGLQFVKCPPHPDQNTEQYKENEQLLKRIGVTDLWDFIKENTKKIQPQVSTAEESSLPLPSLANNCTTNSPTDDANNNDICDRHTNNNDNKNTSDNRNSSCDSINIAEGSAIGSNDNDLTEALHHLNSLEQQTRAFLNMVQELKVKVIGGRERRVQPTPPNFMTPQSAIPQIK